MSLLSPQEAARIKARRVAHLATADAQGAPHLVPICFVFDGDHFYSALDQKPKRIPVTGLKRVKNILSNPEVALVVDQYEEDWGRLWYVLVRGKALLIQSGEEHRRAIGLLREKYPQYRDMQPEKNPIIKITPTRITSWGKAAQVEGETE